MLLTCGVGEDSWESLGLQGDPSSQSSRRSILNIHWKDWWWSWSSNTLATWWEDPDSGKDWRQEDKGETEDEMVGWHHGLNGHKFEQALGVGEGQGSLVCCSPWGRTQLSGWTELNWNFGQLLWELREKRGGCDFLQMEKFKLSESGRDSFMIGQQILI